MQQEGSIPAEFTFVCPLPNGLHVRPASLLAELATRFHSGVSVVNRRNGAVANLKSTLGILAADIRHGDNCSVQIRGEGAAMAEKALRDFILNDLPNSDEPEAAKAVAGGTLPRGLQSAEIHYIAGAGVSSGIGVGKAVPVVSPHMTPEIAEATADPAAEERHLERGITAVGDRTRNMLAHAASPAEAGLLKAHLALLDDVTFREELQRGIARGNTAEKSVFDAGQHFASLLQHSASAYIRDRAVDIQDMCAQLLQELNGRPADSSSVELYEPSVLLAESLGPQQLLAADRRWLRGLVLEYAGTTSHTVILARSLGIPTVVGVKGAPAWLRAGEQIIVDANRGLVIAGGTEAVDRFYKRELRAISRRHENLLANSAAMARTADGQLLSVGANASSREEVEAAFSQGADAVGLFRSEILFLGRDVSPTEEEQFEIYKDLAICAGQREVTIRTLDAGGDKPIPHLRLPAESNPYLGFRGVRIYPEHRELFRTQLRAILRASGFGRIRMMAPMVSSLDEVRWLKSQIVDAQQQLSQQNIAFDAAMPIGIMIEVPSVAFILDQLCAEVDFFSIGTNDLAQYFMAADRDNARVAALSNVRHPGFLRFLRHIVDCVHVGGKRVAMCGEMAADVHNLRLLVGLGLDEISAAPSQLPFLKREIRRLSARACAELLEKATACGSVDDVNVLLAKSHAQDVHEPLLDAGLVILDSESRTKEEVIRELVDALYVAGRTDEPDRIEEAVWARESLYSTGVGHGFAIPHGRTDATRADSVAVLKLRHPVPWGSPADEPVTTVILLAVRDSEVDNNHMKVLARLARQLMDESFRRSLSALDDSAGITQYLVSCLQLQPSPGPQ